MLRVGVVSGTGAGLPEGLDLRVATPYGEIPLRHAKVGDVDVFAVARHAGGLPPHRVNYLGNVEALARSRVDVVFALNTVGSLVPEVEPGTLLVPDDWMDLSGRAHLTFFDEAPVHVDVSEPYCPVARRALLGAVEGARVRDGGTYVAVSGPRLETPAESRRLASLGGHVVGMTGCPEAGIARERGLHYATLALVANRAPGTGEAVSAAAIRDAAAALSTTAWRAVLRAGAAFPATPSCACERALDGARS